MIGPRGVANALAAHLEVHLDAEVVRLEGELGPVLDPTWTDADLHPPLSARPQLIASVQLPPLAVHIGDWPFVLVIVRRMATQRRIDVDDDGSITYERDYPTRLFGYGRGTGYHATAAVRDRLILALTETILRRQTFGAAGGAMRVVETGLVEEYSDTTLAGDATADTIAGAYIETVVRSTEVLTPVEDPFGPMTEAALDTPHLPPHPAL